MDVEMHVRVGAPPVRSYALCDAGTAGVQKITVTCAGAFRAPASARAQDVRELTRDALNGWERYVGSDEGPIGSLRGRLAGRVAWDDVKPVAHAVRALDIAARGGDREPDGARGALAAVAGGDRERAQQLCDRAFHAVIGTHARAVDEKARAGVERKASGEAFEGVRNGHDEALTEQWLDAVGALRRAGDTEGLQAVAQSLDGARRDLDGSRDPALPEKGLLAPHTDRLAALGVTARLVGDGRGAEEAARHARASVSECAKTNAVIDRTAREGGRMAARELLARVDPGQAMMSVTGGLTWEVGAVGASRVLEQAGPAPSIDVDADRQIAARAGAHAQLAVHPEGVVAAAWMHMLEACGMGKEARAEQSARWAGEAWWEVVADARAQGADAPPGPLAALGRVVHDAHERGAPVLAPPSTRSQGRRWKWRARCATPTGGARRCMRWARHRGSRVPRPSGLEAARAASGEARSLGPSSSCLPSGVRPLGRGVPGLHCGIKK